MDDACCGLFPSLTMRQRVSGFVMCFAAGIVCGFLATMSFCASRARRRSTRAPLTPAHAETITLARDAGGGAKKSRQFAVLYTLGNLLSLSSSMFLVGPRRQLRR